MALACRAHGYQASFLFARPDYVNLKPDRAWCRLNGIAAYDPGTKLAPSERTRRADELAAQLENGYVPYSLRRPARPAPSARRLLTAVLYPFLALLELAWSKPRLAMERRRRTPHLPLGAYFPFARRLLDRVAPDALVFGQEFPGSVNSLLTPLAQERGIPTFIIPFALGTTKEMCESLVDNPYHDVEFSLLNRVAARLYPRWVNYYGGKELLRLPGHHVIAIEGLGLAPEHPWLPNNSRADRILVESQVMADYYRRMQFSEGQVRVTGATSDDQLAEAMRERDKRRERLAKRLEVDPHKPLLVCAWPTDQYGSRQRALQFPTYERLCQAWAHALGMVKRTTDYEIVVRLHPVTRRDKVMPFLDQHDLTLTEIDTLELVPVCELFVACVSSTLRWAAACGIPAVNYDCYDYGYTDFDSAGGLFTVRQQSEFEETLERLTTDPHVYFEAAAAQRASAPQWGIHDGRSMDRIFAEIDAIVGRAPAAAGVPAALKA